MKEKKKMTKAEAFEYLKGKRVLCGAYSREIQDFAKSVGFNWSSCKDEYWLVLALFFGKDGRLTYTLSPKQFENHDDYEEISADDILSIEIVEEEDTSMPRVELERYVKILQAWAKRINSSFVFSERGMGVIRGDLLTKLESEEKGTYFTIEAKF